MNEKEAITDTLSNCNAVINMLTYSIGQGNDKNLRDTFARYRDELEELQYEIYLIAKQKGYYVPAAPGGQADKDAVKNAVSGK
jgi:spore coat protein CotF